MCIIRNSLKPVFDRVQLWHWYSCYHWDLPFVVFKHKNHVKVPHLKLRTTRSHNTHSYIPHTHMHTHTLTCTHTHSYTHTCTHTHTCTLSKCTSSTSSSTSTKGGCSERLTKQLVVGWSVTVLRNGTPKNLQHIHTHRSHDHTEKKPISLIKEQEQK